MAQEEVGGEVEEADDRPEDGVEQSQGRAEQEGDLNGLADGERLRGQFAKHDVEERDERERNDEGDGRDDRRRGDAGQMECRLDHVGEEGLAEPTQSEAGQGDAQLGGRDVGLEMGGDVFGELGAGVTLLDQGVELAGPDLDDGQLRGDEEPVEQDQREDGQKAEDDDVP